MKAYIMKKQKENKEKNKKVIVFPEVKTSWEIYRVSDGTRLELCDSEQAANNLLEQMDSHIEAAIRSVLFRKDRESGKWIGRPSTR